MWYEDPFLIIFGSLVTLAAVALVFSALISFFGGLSTAIIVVVTIGGAGQILQGYAEFRKGDQIKAAGYYLSSVAYFITAGVALFNGIPQLLK
jgi:hypothetical protein